MKRIEINPLQAADIAAILNLLDVYFDAKVAIVAVTDDGAIGLAKNSALTFEELKKAVDEFASVPVPYRHTADGELVDLRKQH